MQIKSSEIPPHTSQNDHHEKVHKQMLREGVEKENSPTLLVEK